MSQVSQRLILMNESSQPKTDINGPPRVLQAPFNEVTLSIIGDDAATTFFGIDSSTGTINLARSIQTDTETSYTVSRASLCRRLWGGGGGSTSH